MNYGLPDHDDPSMHVQQKFHVQSLATETGFGLLNI